MANNYDAMNEIYFGAAVRKAKAYTDEAVENVKEGISFVDSVADLPPIGDPKTIYYVSTPTSAQDGVYDIYVWNKDTSAYVYRGTTQIDLDDYATDEELDARVAPLEDLADNFSVEDGKLCYVVSEGNSDGGEFMTSYEDLNQLMTKNTGIGLSENGDLMTELSQAGNVSVFIKTGYSNNPYLARFYAQDGTSSISSENIIITENISSIEIVNTSNVNIRVKFYSKNASDLWDGFVTDPALQNYLIPANSMATVEYVGVYLDGEFFDNLYRNKPLALDETLQDLVAAVEQIADNVSTVVESTVSTQVAEQLPSAVEDQISPIVEEQVEDQIDDVVAAKLPAEVTRQIGTPTTQAVKNYCDENFQEWAGGLDSTLTQPLMAAPADKVGELKSALNNRIYTVNPTNLANPILLTVGKYATGYVGSAIELRDNANFAFFKIPITPTVHFTVSGTSFAVQVTDENDEKLAEYGSSSGDVADFTFYTNDSHARYAYVNFKPKKFPIPTYMINEGDELAEYEHYFLPYFEIGGVDHYALSKDVYIVNASDNLIDLFKYLTNDDSEKYIYIKGNHDLFTELGGSTYAQSIESGTDWRDCNVFVPKNTHLIGLGNATLTFKPTAIQIGTVAMELLSPINVDTADFWMENIRIDAENCRYCIHDDTSNLTYFGSNQKHMHHYKNVHCVKGAGGNPQCYGGGNTDSVNFSFEDCYFESYSLPWSTHNNVNENSSQYNCANFVFSGCAFNNKGNTDYSLRFGNVTWRQENIGVLLTNCAANKKIYLYKEGAGDTIKNAYNLTIVKSSYSEIYEDSMTNIFTPIIMN